MAAQTSTSSSTASSLEQKRIIRIVSATQDVLDAGRIYEPGELIHDKTNNILKIGDGSTAYADLDPILGGGGSSGSGGYNPPTGLILWTITNEAPIRDCLPLDGRKINKRVNPELEPLWKYIRNYANNFGASHPYIDGPAYREADALPAGPDEAYLPDFTEMFIRCLTNNPIGFTNYGIKYEREQPDNLTQFANSKLVRTRVSGNVVTHGIAVTVGTLGRPAGVVQISDAPVGFHRHFAARDSGIGQEDNPTDNVRTFTTIRNSLERTNSISSNLSSSLTDEQRESRIEDVKNLPMEVRITTSSALRTDNNGVLEGVFSINDVRLATQRTFERQQGSYSLVSVRTPQNSSVNEPDRCITSGPVKPRLQLTVNDPNALETTGQVNRYDPIAVEGDGNNSNFPINQGVYPWVAI